MPVNLREALNESGQVGRDLLAVDWDKTPLGGPEAWPSSLSTMVRVVLGSRFSMWMAWGPELTFFCNDAYRRDTLGRKYPWALGRPAREVWAEIWDDIGPRIDKMLTTGQATWDESLLLFLERSGYPEETYHTFSYSPLFDDTGETSGMLCVVSEDTERVIGERRMATLRLVGSETTAGRSDREYLAAAGRHLAANPRSLIFSLIYLFDAGGQCAELVSTTGIHAGHPAAPPAIELTAKEPAWPAAVLRAGREVIDSGVQRFAELPSGEWRDPPTTAVLLPLRPPGQEEPYGFLVVGANRYRPLDDDYRSFLALLAAQLASGVASTRAWEAERRRAEELERLDRAKTAFFTNVSHELRTPLTLLLGPAEDALADRDDPLSEHQRHRMEIIARSGQRLLKLVGDLLDVSRLESGRAQAVFEPVDLGRYTAELASMFETAVRRAGLELRVECEPLPEPAYADREMWAKIVLNLLSNALKFTFAGSITVRVRLHGDGVRLEVIDTGIGIPAAEQPRLFERFHRVLGAQGRTHEGSGVGLALVSELAQLHGGAVTVSSEPATGSTFAVEIPLGFAHLPAERIVDAPREHSIEREVAGFLAEAGRWLNPAAEGPASVAGASASHRVLVADDNADMRDYITDVLSARFAVERAADGQEALERALAAPPDLVLTDVMMPRLDGFGLLARLREDPRTAHLPVVMLSARAGEEGIIEGLEAGADDYLIKPFGARELIARVTANLELDRVRRTRDELERSQRLLTQAERLAGIGSWELDLTTGLLRGSEQLVRLLAPGSAPGQRVHSWHGLEEVVHPDDRAWVREAVSVAVEEGGPLAYEARLVAVEGGERWVRVRGEPVYDEHGRRVALRGFVQDITQQRRAEQAMAAAAAARRAAEREHEIADALQRSLLPPASFNSEHLEVASYYQAGVEGVRVGGDWYDTIDLGAGRTALVIGDVAGRGVRAASVMGQLRAAVRAYARLDLPPSEVLELLDAMVRELAPGSLVTCIYGVYEPGARELHYANAGHLPPLLARPDREATLLPGASGPPLGVGSTQFGEHRVSLETGAVVAFYTDGLVERRDRDLDRGLAMLATAIDPVDSELAALPGALVRALAPEGSEDDIAILVARIAEHPVERSATLDVPPVAQELSRARQFATTTLRDWELPEEIVEDAGLIVSELLTNAIVHGRPPIRLRLLKTPAELAIEVDDGASAMPRKLRVSSEVLHGRGLSLVADMSTRWAARANGIGKTVWSTLALPERERVLHNGDGHDQGRR